MPYLEVVEVDADKLLPYARNAKIHTMAQIDQIAESITQFGNCDPIGAWHNEDGEIEIVEGHGRLMALNKLGVEKVPVIFLDHLTDNQRRAYALIHNKLTMNSDFDYDQLREELEGMSSIDMEPFGFSAEDLEEFQEAQEDAARDEQDGGEFETVRCPYCGHENLFRK